MTLKQKHPFRIVSAMVLMVLVACGGYPRVVTATSWSFAVLGDQRDEGSYGINKDIVEKMAAQIASQNPAFVLCGGDQIHGRFNSGELALPDQYNHWLAAMAPVLNIAYPVRGNHETHGDEGNGHPYAYYWQTYMVGNLPQIPLNGPPNEVGMNYSFSHSNAFIIGLEESYATSWYQVNQTWLNQQLAANTLPWTFAYGHYPAFGFADPLEPGSLAEHPAQRDAFWKSLGDSSVNIYFCGHVHVYNRGRVAIDGGPEIQQIVIGTGGAPLTSWHDYSDPRVILESHLEHQYGYTMVTVDGNTLTAVFYAYDSATDTWSPYDIYTYTLIARKFGANGANQAIDPATLTDFYQGIKLIKIGLGTLTLNPGTSTYADAITVSAGGLKVQGDYPNAPVIVQSGGSLSGTGTIGNVTNSGTVSPGNSPGTMTVTGSYTQTASGTLAVEVASPTSYDKLAVTGTPGTASLNGTLKPILLNGYVPQGNQVFTGVVTADNGITGTFSTAGNFTPTLAGRALYGPNEVDLMAVRNYLNSALNLTGNQRAVGVMLNGVAGAATGDLNTVLNAIDSLTSPGAVANAYQQISADKVAALSTLAFAGANLQKGVLSRRLTDLRFAGREGGALGGLPGSFGLNYSQLSGLMLAYNSSNLAGMLTSERKAGLAAPQGRWGVYIDPAMVFGAQQSSANQTGFNFTIAGFNAGADYRVRDDLLVGLASGYSHTGAAFHGSGGSVENSTWPLTAYAAYLPQSFYAYGSLGYALNLFDLKRQISFDGLNRTASSSPTGNQFNAYGEAGYDLKFSPVVVTPVVSLAYSSLWVDHFTESGAGALDLNVSSQHASSLQTGVGGKIALPLRRNSVVVVPQIYATYQHEYSDSSRGLDARLSQAGSTFTFQTDNPHRNFAVAGASVDILTGKNLQVRLDYNAEVGRGNYSAHYASGGVRWQF